MIKSFRDLDIYVESKALANAVHTLSLTFPKFELYEEGSQLRRSSKAVTALIVEGFGRRRYPQDYVKFLTYSLAECDETIVHLDFVFETDSFTDGQKYLELRNSYTTLSKKINKFIQWVEKEMVRK